MFEGVWTQEIHSHPAWVQNSVCGNLYCLADEQLLECMSHLSQTIVVTITHWEKEILSATNQQQSNNIAFLELSIQSMAWSKIFSWRKGLKECPGRIPSRIPSHESVSCLAAQFRCCYWNNERKSTGQGLLCLRDAVKRRTVQYWDLCGDCATKWSSWWLLLWSLWKPLSWHKKAHLRSGSSMCNTIMTSSKISRMPSIKISSFCLSSHYKTNVEKQIFIVRLISCKVVVLLSSCIDRIFIEIRQKRHNSFVLENAELCTHF